MEQKKLKSNWKNAKPVVSAQVNPWGLHFVGPNTIEYSFKKVKLTVQGGIQLKPADRLEVSLKAMRTPQLSTTDVYRGKVDLLSDHRVEAIIVTISERIKETKHAVREAIYSLTERLERYRNYELSEKEAHPLEVERGQYKSSTELKRLLNSKSTNKEIKSLIEKVGLPGTGLLNTLYQLTFSRYLIHPQHVILIGEHMLCSQLLSSLTELLPKAEFVKSNALHERELFGQKSGYWKNKCLIGQNLSNLSDKSSLYRFILEGEVTRIGMARQKEVTIEGPVQLIGFSQTGNHPLLDSPSVIAIEVDEQTLSKEMMELQLLKHSGSIDEKSQDAAKKLLWEYQQVDAPTGIQNEYLDKLGLLEHFKTSPALLEQFLKLSDTMALARRDWKFSCYVKPEDMILACEILKNSWNSKMGLSLQVEATLKSAKELGSSFTSSELRISSDNSPKTTERHLNILIDKGLLERVNGDRYNGFRYQLTKKKTEDSVEWIHLVKKLNKL